jgi:hypothetical protein
VLEYLHALQGSVFNPQYQKKQNTRRKNIGSYVAVFIDGYLSHMNALMGKYFRKM